MVQDQGSCASFIFKESSWPRGLNCFDDWGNGELNTCACTRMLLAWNPRIDFCFFRNDDFTPRCHISSGFLLPVFRKNILNNYYCHRDFRSIKSSWWKTSPLQINHQGSQRLATPKMPTQTASQSPAWKRFSWGFAGSPQPQPNYGKLTGAGYISGKLTRQIGKFPGSFMFILGNIFIHASCFIDMLDYVTIMAKKLLWLQST